MPDTDVYQLACDQTVGRSTAVNVWHFQQIGDTSGGNMPEKKLAETFEESIQMQMAAFLSQEWSVFCLRVRRVFPDQGSEFIYVPTDNTVGLNTSSVLPPNQAAVLSLYTENYGKKGRGRKYIAGVPLDAESANHLTNAGLLGLQAIGMGAIADLPAPSDTSLWRAGLLEKPGDIWHPFVRYEARSPLRKLRGRTSTICSPSS